MLKEEKDPLTILRGQKYIAVPHATAIAAHLSKLLNKVERDCNTPLELICQTDLFEEYYNYSNSRHKA